MGNGETYLRISKQKTDFLFLTNFPNASNDSNFYNKHLCIFTYYVYVTTLQDQVFYCCIDHFFYFSPARILGLQPRDKI